jgi:hypothetical protein
MSRTSLWARMRGDIEFSLAELQQVAAALDMSVTDFLPTPSTRTGSTP